MLCYSNRTNKKCLIINVKRKKLYTRIRACGKLLVFRRWKNRFYRRMSIHRHEVSPEDLRDESDLPASLQLYNIPGSQIKLINLSRCCSHRRRRRGGGGRGGHVLPLPQIRDYIFFGQLLCKIRAFSGKNQVKFIREFW